MINSKFPVTAYLALLLTASGCASLASLYGTDEISENLDPTETVPVSKDYKQTLFKSGYYAAKGSQKSYEWTLCRHEGAKSAYLLFHDEGSAGWKLNELCRNGIAQAFLSKGHDVIAINRPGHGTSEGPSLSLRKEAGALYQAALASYARKVPNATSHSLHAWGDGMGASLAGSFAKESKKMESMVFYRGIYDFPFAAENTGDAGLKKEIAALKDAKNGLNLDDLSLAYDFEGLPKKVRIYHPKKSAVPLQQASDFANALESSSYDMKFLELEGQDSSISEALHYQVLRKLID